jgi:hypothetical protein
VKDIDADLNAQSLMAEVVAAIRNSPSDSYTAGLQLEMVASYSLGKLGMHRAPADDFEVVDLVVENSCSYAEALSRRLALGLAHER